MLLMLQLIREVEEILCGEPLEGYTYGKQVADVYIPPVHPPQPAQAPNTCTIDSERRPQKHHAEYFE